MLKANNGPNGGPGGSGGGGNSTPLQTPTSASTPQSPPETPESQSPGPMSGNGSGHNLDLRPGGNGSANNSSGSMQSNNAQSPPLTLNSPGLPGVGQWDMSAKPSAMSAMSMNNSYNPHAHPHPSLPQYSWYHHGHHDPGMNPQHLLT